MHQLVVVVEERQVQLGWLREGAHHDYPAELVLVLFEDVDVLSHLPSSLVLVLGLQIDIAPGVHVVQNCANFSKTRQNLSHEHFRIANIFAVELLRRGLLDLLIVNLLCLPFLPDQPNLEEDLPMRGIVQLKFSLKEPSKLLANPWFNSLNQIIDDDIRIQIVMALIHIVIDGFQFQFEFLMRLMMGIVPTLDDLGRIKLILQTISVETFILLGTD